MKVASLLVSVFSASLLTASFAEAGAFGYVNLKAGYSHESLAKSVFSSVVENKSAYLKSSVASSYPFGGSLGLGYAFTPHFGLRFEAEYLYRLKANFKKDALLVDDPMKPVSEFSVRPQTQIQSLLGNVYLDYYLTPSVNLYLSGGVGASLIDATLEYYNSTKHESGKMTALKKSALAWQAGGGIGIALSQNFGFDLNVRYVDFGKARFNPTEKLPAVANIPLSAIEGLVGLNYRF